MPRIIQSNENICCVEINERDCFICPKEISKLNTRRHHYKDDETTDSRFKMIETIRIQKIVRIIYKMFQVFIDLTYHSY